MTTVDVVSEISIARPRKVVAAFAANPDNAPAWYKNIKTVEWKTPPPVRIGSHMAYTYEIVEFVPDQSLTMRTSAGPFPMATTYT